MGWLVSTLAASKHSWMSSQMQWVSELTVPGQLSTIESQGNSWECCKIGELQHQQCGAWADATSKPPPQGRLNRTPCWFGWNCRFSYIFKEHFLFELLMIWYELPILLQSQFSCKNVVFASSCLLFPREDVCGHVDHHQFHYTWVLHLSSVTESLLVRPLKSAATTLISVSFS